MYTTHGHHISGTVYLQEEPPATIARCGGPGLCTVCTKDVYYFKNQQTSLSDQTDLVSEESTPMNGTTTYSRKSFDVEAAEVTEENMAWVAEWCNGDLLEDSRPYIKVRVTRPLNERQTKAYPGDWVLYAGTGFKVYTPKAFHKTFEVKDNVEHSEHTEETLEELRVVDVTPEQPEREESSMPVEE